MNGAMHMAFEEDAIPVRIRDSGLRWTSNSA